MNKHLVLLRWFFFSTMIWNQRLIMRNDKSDEFNYS